MKRVLVLVCVALLVVGLATTPAFAGETHSGKVFSSAVVSPLATDDALPGVPIPPSPIVDSLTWPTDPDDVFSIYLTADSEATFVLPEPAGGRDYDLILYGPGASSFADAPVVLLDTGYYPEALGFRAPVSGTYYLRVMDYDGYFGAGVGTDTYTLRYTVVNSTLSNNVPGVPLPASTVIGAIEAGAERDDVYRFFMRKGDRIQFSMPQGQRYADTGDPGYNIDMYLYGPGTTDVYSDPWLLWSETGSYPETLDYTATDTGYYFLDVYGDGTLQEVNYQISWTLTPTPLTTVWRFYNVTNGTHFFTSSAEEADMVLAKWPTIFKLDGVAYQDNPLTNDQPLYRFYNKVSKSHFYTASAEEAAHVIATWPAIFTYEGPTYTVRSAQGSPFDVPVYRFFNKRTGSHFYTASAEEADHVIATWPHIYQYDGIAYYLGQ